jgi:hypothetical protein
MAYTAALGQLIQQLRTDTALQNAYRASAQAVLDDFDLTPHEHDAVMTRDHDDLVALGVVSSISDLPEVLRGGARDPGVKLPGGSLVDRLRDLLENVANRLPRPFNRLPIPRRPAPPEPGPGPAPGPDPPGPDGGGGGG